MSPAVACRALILALAARGEGSERAQDPGIRPEGRRARPDIVVILADDLGWKDVGYHGSDIQTPNIDRLARAGVRLEQFYVLPKCTPTRAGLMTGRHPIHYGLQTGVIEPGDAYGLDLAERTLAQALRDAGYTTAIAGKWHLGDFERAYLPTERGFDRQYGPHGGASDYFTHHRDGELDWFRDDQPLKEEGYATTLIADEAVRVLAVKDREKPLFLYVPFTAVHGPLHTVKEFAGRSADVREYRRHQRASMVAALDDGVGKIARAIEESGRASETLVFFASDNGGPGGAAWASDNAPLRGGKGKLYEGGVRVVAFLVWPGAIEPGSVVEEPLHVVDLFPTLAGLAGAPLAGGRALDGKDAWPTIARGAPSPHEAFLLNTEASQGAVRAGKWKLVVTAATHKSPREVELFDLARDPGEKHNLAAAEPERAKELEARLDEWTRRAAPAKRTSDSDD